MTKCRRANSVNRRLNLVIYALWRTISGKQRVYATNGSSSNITPEYKLLVQPVNVYRAVYQDDIRKLFIRVLNGFAILQIARRAAELS